MKKELILCLAAGACVGLVIGFVLWNQQIQSSSTTPEKTETFRVDLHSIELGMEGGTPSFYAFECKNMYEKIYGQNKDNVKECYITSARAGTNILLQEVECKCWLTH
ncbi:MAG: hypothetical protein HYT16_02600 [DPANN group archaeon]|nr:hypothetical protein [DPANN group archaeon]